VAVLAKVTALGCAIVVATGSVVAAQRRPAASPPTAELPDPRAEAREHFVRGVELYDEGEYEPALAEFRRSHELQAVPGVLINVALCLEELHRYDDAISTYREYLRTAERASADRRRAAEEAIALLEERIASVTIEVDRPGAEILIDGRSVGTSPLPAPLRLAAGVRVIEVRLEGFVSVREELEVAGRVAREIPIRLAPLDRNGLVRVSAEPAETIVRIDGLEVGHAPVERRLPMGGHVVEGFLDAYRTYRTDIQLADRQELDLRLVLEREGPSITSEWWFWTIIGVGVAGAAAAVTAGVVCGTSDACTTSVVIEGNVDPGVIRL
jgi:tetratricopeptide (TPR) repeat protein